MKDNLFVCRILLEKIKSGALDPDQAPAITAQDEEDLWSVELAQFKAESRTTGKYFDKCYFVKWLE